MCFVLYVASDIPIPDMPFDQNSPALNTKPLTDRESPIQNVFSKPNVKFLGSSTNCGCGFRNLSFQNGGWPEEYLVDLDPEFGAGTQDDHKSLHRFLMSQLDSTEQIEIYGCWDGDFDAEPARHETIDVAQTLRDDFFLRERCLYTVKQ